MAVKMPEINITFEQLSTTAIERSERGTAILIVKDDTDDSLSYVKFSNSSEIEEVEDSFTSSNIQYMKDVFVGSAYELLVVRIGTEDPVTNALNIILSLRKSGWITIADGTTDQFNSLASWIKDKYNTGYTYKCVVYQIDGLDHRQIVNFYNTTVEFDDDRGEVTGLSYLPTLIGILAGLNITRSATYYTCSNLVSTSIVEEDEYDDWLDKGRLFLFIDEETVKIASGINSLTTLDGSTSTEDMRYIETVEVMNLINDDIRDVFKSTYIGKYKNNYINQLMFISSIKAYFTDLADDNILDAEYENTVEIDVDAQKTAWESTGKDMSDMDDQTVRKTTYKRSVFLKGDIKILNCMENLDFAINLY